MGDAGHAGVSRKEEFKREARIQIAGGRRSAGWILSSTDIKSHVTG